MDEVYAILAGQTEAEAIELGSAPGEPGRTRSLPKVSISDLAGLLEYVSELPDDRADIYRLASELSIDSGQVLSLTEATELLGFAHVEKGDITLTSLGETFAEASILARKEIFAARIRRLPLMRWLTTMLTHSENHSLAWDVIQTALGLEFSHAEAEKNWRS